ncbi:MAG TPA: nickel pincer cofactor biosynthesis protein LarB [Candidatus Avipropionibacterium avicola]|uniref:Nickel pincer cofactor biosynthesis protein LarB n=1 Tax=Candidatus Avipropionibacterium avicola TaxID=2840701 RepID=A0A9D1GXB4_9ACTN|nr:nickel pincer cofactor biosynthesis protein LarB [Candidatus Avipropionibacterium avicola]
MPAESRPDPDPPAPGADASGDPWARLDFDRARRTGDPEVVFGSGKTPDQVVQLLTELHAAHPGRAVLATRLDEATRALVAERLPAASVDPVARTATLGPMPTPSGTVAVIAAGTSDQDVAAEVAVTVACFGSRVQRINDVGVAGIHRLLDAKPEFDSADALVVVAGMEGALPSVVAGLTGTPLVAVPTSVGYGASFGGLSALLAMLNSCAPGVVVTNIDGGFTAGVHAARIARTAHHPEETR